MKAYSDPKREHNPYALPDVEIWHHEHAKNPRFNRERWLNYIAGKCGPKGGKVVA